MKKPRVVAGAEVCRNVDARKARPACSTRMYHMSMLQNLMKIRGV